MRARQGDDYPPRFDDVYTAARDASGEEIYRVEGNDVPDLWTDWELRCLYELESPDIEHRSATLDDGSRIMWLLGPDGSWARAEQASGVVHESGPRRLWGEFDRTRSRWYNAGRFPLHRMSAEFGPERSVLLSPDKDWRFEL
ncbi:hypothetical protein ACFVWG_09370 [Kribbella sp. NPDC058245]|uniref:hypothetical protein n=1 Tax=Kribbella sp. NPDC058245 TaxID=3346399 RepID=UPI0036F0C8CB